MTSKFLRHVACEACGSSDAGSLYDDGHMHCFACSSTVQDYEEETTYVAPKQHFKPMTNESVEYKSIPERGITRQTCEKYGVVADSKEHTYPYTDKDGKIVAAKHRTVATKEFKASGDFKSAVLFGQHLFHSGGKYVTVVEGELDALAAFQMTGSQWPVVSIKNGAAAALKDLQANFEWLDTFETVVLSFDNDKPGKEAAEKCAALFPGKVKVMKHVGSYKDASDYLTAGAEKEFINAWWRAEEYRPEGIVTVSDIMDKLLKPREAGIPWCFPSLTKYTLGRRPGELYGFGAGVGVGKTDVFTQSIAYDIDTLNEKVGVIYLEQPVEETATRVAGKLDNKLYHIPDAGWTREEYVDAVHRLEARKKLHMFSHFGAKDWESVKKVIRYFAKAHGIRMIYLDHLTALAAGLDDERRGLDAILADMAGLAQADGLIIHFVSHLTTPEGKAHEEGGRVLEKHFTGSRAIARWAHCLFGLERNKQEEDPVKRQTTTFRVLKERWTGQGTGEKFGLFYNKETGILTECALEPEMQAL